MKKGSEIWSETPKRISYPFLLLYLPYPFEYTTNSWEPILHLIYGCKETLDDKNTYVTIPCCVPAGNFGGQYHTIHCGVDNNHESFDNVGTLTFLVFLAYQAESYSHIIRVSFKT